MNWIKKLSPAKLGLPDKYSRWRPHQAEAIGDVIGDEARFSGVNAPTGLGKSLVGMALAMVEDIRTVYLVSTKALQDQLMKDFSGCGLKLVKGRNNYWCQAMGGVYTCEEYSRDCRAKICPELEFEMAEGVAPQYRHTCNALSCETWAGECPYRKAYQAAVGSRLVVTNYAYWVQVNRFAGGLGEVGMLIADEAHALPEELCGLMSTTVTPRDLAELGMDPPDDDEITFAWREWAGELTAKAAADGWMDQVIARMTAGEFGSRDAVRARNRLEKVMQKMGVLATMKGRWVVEAVKEGWQFDPVWPFQHTESWVWRGVPKVVLMSATLTPKTLSLLGIGKDKYRFHAYPYVFPKRNAPVWHIRSAAVNHRMKEGNRLRWLGMIAQTLKRRTDRKGIIHTVSYKRRDEIVNYLAERHPDLLPYCLTHEPWETAEVIRRFKAGREPRWLISPSITTGYDFPGTECEFVLWAKLPFPYSQSEVMRARQKEDDQYGAYLMIQDLVQGAGRAMRSKDDHCETLILDDSWFWVKRRFGHLIPDWFRPQTKETIPPPPPRLEVIREMEHEALEGSPEGELASEGIVFQLPVWKP